MTEVASNVKAPPAPPPQLSRPQLKKLQVLWGQFARKLLDVGSGREARLAWASAELRRPVASFSALTAAEASQLMETLNAALGLRSKPPQRPGLGKPLGKPIRDRDRARAAGTEGRRGSPNTVTLVSAEDLARIQQQLDRLEWTQQTFRNWLASRFSPLARSGQKEIRTLAQANKIYWALKNIKVRVQGEVG